MNCSVLLGSSSVVLTIPSQVVAQSEPPRMDAIVLSIVRHSGLLEAARIDVQANGIPKAFSGETWAAGWLLVGSNWELKLGLPNSLIATNFDSIERMGIEIIAKVYRGKSLTLAVVDIDVISAQEKGESLIPCWLPETFTV